MKKVNDINDKNPFKVPENYFEELNRKIISVTSGDHRVILKTDLYSRFRPYLLVAASVAVLFILSYSAIKLTSRRKAEIQVSEVLYREYAESYMNDIDLYSLEESAAEIIPFNELTEISDSDIIDYLLLDNIDINEIYDQL